MNHLRRNSRARVILFLGHLEDWVSERRWAPVWRSLFRTEAPGLSASSIAGSALLIVVGRGLLHLADIKSQRP
jgi:hypothetical protein